MFDDVLCAGYSVLVDVSIFIVANTFVSKNNLTADDFTDPFQRKKTRSSTAPNGRSFLRLPRLKMFSTLCFDVIAAAARRVHLAERSGKR